VGAIANAKTPHFISISGLAGSGKNTVADYLKTYFREQNYTINDFSFAGPLKDCLCLWFGWDRDRLNNDFAYKEGATLDDGSPDPYCERLGMTRRMIMQKMGTECMRDGMHKDFWIIMADLGVKLGKIPHSDFYIISDARFLNELEWAKSINAYRIFIDRTDIINGETLSGTTLTAHTTHASETEFVGWSGYDEYISNTITEGWTQEQNLNFLYNHLDNVTIPFIHHRFGI
jgi:hypothetical protein